MFKIDKERVIVEDLKYPGYDETADIEVLNENFRKLKEKNKSQDNEIKGKEPAFEKKSGFNLEKTDLVEDDSNKVITPKGVLNLKNWLVEAYTNAINTTKSALENLIRNKLNHGGYSGTGQDLNNEISKKASKTQLGRMKVGRNLTVDEDGTVHGNPSYTHPTGNGNNHIPANGASGNFLKWLSSGVAQWASIAWGDITGKPSVFPPSSHTHTKASITDFPTSMKNPNALTISLNGTSQGAYDGSGVKNINITPGSINSYTKQEVDSKVNGRLPSGGKAVDSSKLNGIVNSTGATANTIAQRDSAGDINVRLVRSNYGNESRMTGAVAFRVNTSDNYIRFCSDPGAFRDWLGVKNSTMEVLWSGSVGYGATISLNKDLRKYSLIIFDFGGDAGGGFFSNPLVYPINPSASSFMVVLTDTWGGTVHKVDATIGKITYTNAYNGGAHGENRFKRIIGIKL